MDCHFEDKENGRTKFFAFDWEDGGFNFVIARDKEDAINLANESFNDPVLLAIGRVRLVVNEDSVYETDSDTFFKRQHSVWGWKHAAAQNSETAPPESKG